VPQIGFYIKTLILWSMNIEHASIQQATFCTMFSFIFDLMLLIAIPKKI